MTHLTLTVPVPPSANVYWRTRSMPNRRTGWPPRAITYLSKEAKAFKADVAAMAQALNLQPLDGEVIVVLDWYREKKAGDLDNRIKCLLDGLNGVAYHDDKQVRRIVATRYDDKADPRVEVRVWAWAERTAALAAAHLLPEVA